MNPRPRRLPLRGRDYELGVLSEQLAAAHSGAGSVSVIEAGPGLGKTRLIEEAIALAGRSSVAAGRGDGDQAKLAVYLAPLLEALFQGKRPLLDRSATLEKRGRPGLLAAARAVGIAGSTSQKRADADLPGRPAVG